MTKTLWETFLSAFAESTMIPWKVYGNHSHRLLCADYRYLKNDDTLDDLMIVKCSRKNGYWRIVVED